MEDAGLKTPRVGDPARPESSSGRPKIGDSRPSAGRVGDRLR